MKKIEKLDRILTQKIETEREVKRERFAVEKDFQRQIQRLIDEKGVENVVGSQQLLSLCAATDLKEETINQDDDFPSPIFATQIDSEFYKDNGENQKAQRSSENQHRARSSTDSPRSATTKDGEQQEKKKVDFIKRNINLASQYNETVALTEEEKKRLEELLADDNDLFIGENPFTTPAIKDDGFRLSLENQKQMENIDEKLRDFLSEDEYNSNILGESQSSTSIHSLQEDRSLTNTDHAETHVECGEKVLNDGVAQRNMVQRLCDIEKRLQELRLEATTPTSDNEDSDSTTTTPRSHQQGRLIDPDLLRSLLDVDSRLTSESRSICDSVRTNSVACFDGDDDEIIGTDCNSTPLPVVDGGSSVDVSLDVHDVSSDNEEESDQKS